MYDCPEPPVCPPELSRKEEAAWLLEEYALLAAEYEDRLCRLNRLAERIEELAGELAELDCPVERKERFS